jgi:hypothetical protein
MDATGIFAKNEPYHELDYLMFLSFHPKYFYSTSRHQFISQGKQGMDLEPEKQVLEASHTSCTCLKYEKGQIGDVAGSLLLPLHASPDVLLALV